MLDYIEVEGQTFAVNAEELKIRVQDLIEGYRGNKSTAIQICVSDAQSFLEQGRYAKAFEALSAEKISYRFGLYPEAPQTATIQFVEDGIVLGETTGRIHPKAECIECGNVTECIAYICRSGFEIEYCANCFEHDVYVQVAETSKGRHAA